MTIYHTSPQTRIPHISIPIEEAFGVIAKYAPPTTPSVATVPQTIPQANYHPQTPEQLVVLHSTGMYIPELDEPRVEKPVDQNPSAAAIPPLTQNEIRLRERFFGRKLDL